MKIYTIGSGNMYSINNSASYLINDSILLDIPNGTCKELKRKNINIMDINHVIITHLHADHFFDLPFYLLSRSNNNIQNSIIYCKEEDNKKLLKLIDISFPNVRKYLSIAFNNKDNFTIDNLNFERRKVNHGDDIESYGYIVSDNNITIGFTGDTSLCKEVEIMASICSTLICDCTRIKGNNYHMGIDNLEYLSKKYKCKIYASHIEDETRKCINNNNFKTLEDGKILLLRK